MTGASRGGSARRVVSRRVVQADQGQGRAAKPLTALSGASRRPAAPWVPAGSEWTGVAPRRARSHRVRGGRAAPLPAMVGEWPAREWSGFWRRECARVRTVADRNTPDSAAWSLAPKAPLPRPSHLPDPMTASNAARSSGSGSAITGHEYLEQVALRILLARHSASRHSASPIFCNG